MSDNQESFLPDPISPRYVRRSNRELVKRFLAITGILTHSSTSTVTLPELKWLAVCPLPTDKGKDIATIMMESCSEYDDLNLSAYGRTEVEAIKKLCGQLRELFTPPF